MAFQRVHSNTIWEYKEKGDVIEGILVKKKMDIGPYKQKVYTIQTPMKLKVDVYGTTILDGLMDHIQIGDIIQIIYQGRNDTKKYHTFDVLKDDGKTTNA